MTMKTEYQALLLDLLVEHSEQNLSMTGIINKYSDKLMELQEHSLNSKNNHRYYLTGFLPDGTGRFLTTALNQKRAEEDANKYLEGYWGFAKIVITVADESFKKEIVRG